MAVSQPRIRRTSQNTQFTYNLSKRIHDVKTYPVQSPQGATILIYGHDNGVTLVWRGGRRFKPPKKHVPTQPPVKEKPNGTNSDVIMLDSDEEEPPPKTKAPAPFVDKPEFESAIDDGEPFPDVVQTLDLSLGIAALHIAVLPITPCLAEDAGSSGADVLKEKMVFAVSTTTADVFLVSLPLTPPSPESKARPELKSSLLAASAGSGQWNDVVTVLTGQTKHSEGLALSISRPTKSSNTSERIREQVGSSTTPSRARLVVAAHNREASGILRLWDVPLDSATQVGENGRVRPFQIEFLPAPLTSISFNPTNPSQLLVVAPTQAVRIYDYALPSLPPDDTITGPFPSKGYWLLSLYQPFARPTPTRKPVIDAAWISHGRAIFALLADGTWGIWDVEGASPLGSTILGKQSSGIQGAALTSFSVSGHVEGTSTLRGVGASRPTGDFVPLTPHSRRDAAASLGSNATPERLATIKGGITVTPLPADGSHHGDESVVLWIGGLDNVSVIPAVAKFWDAQLRRSSGGGVNLFSGTTPTRMIRLQDLATGLLGERCVGVGSAVNFSRHKNNDGGLGIEILVQGETRLAIVRESEDGAAMQTGGILPTRRRLFGDKGAKDPASAIIVHQRPDQPRNVSFNLTVNKKRSVRGPQNGEETTALQGDGDKTHDFTLPIGLPKTGFGFDLDAAADAEDDDQNRNIEEEMLDIMEIDRALDNMEGTSTHKRVSFS